jgi:hypothetical protein
MKMAVLWVVAPHCLVEVYWHFRGACCLHHQGDVEAASTSEMSVNFYQTTWCNNPEDSHLQLCLFLISFPLFLLTFITSCFVHPCHVSSDPSVPHICEEIR